MALTPTPAVYHRAPMSPPIPLRLSVSRLLTLAVLLCSLAGCGGGAPEGGAGGGDSAGGESSAASVSGPALPVPDSAVLRSTMTQALQDAWTLVEITAAQPGPADAGETDADDRIAAWFVNRESVVQQTAALVSVLDAAPIYERAIGAALMGYLLEDISADALDMPVPGGSVTDPELAEANRDARDEQLRTYREGAVSSYFVCVEALDSLADPAWAAWREFCVVRAEENDEFNSMPTGDGEYD